MPDEARYRGRSAGESRVVQALWDEVGGELVEEFRALTVPGEGSRRREVDGVIATDGPRRQHPRGTPLPLHGRDVVVCQAKAGQLDLGVLGQTLFAAELIDRQFHPQHVRLIAAAARPNPLIGRLFKTYQLESEFPLGRPIEHRTYPLLQLPPGASSGAYAPPVIRQELISALHREVGGLLISRAPRSHAHFRKIRTAAGGEPLRQADPDAIILPSRRLDEVTATVALSVAAGEPVVFAYTCADLYMTAMGRAVFGGEIARRLLGLAHVTSFLCYSKDNAVLHGLMDELPHVACRLG
jgi:hypothetical protein